MLVAAAVCVATLLAACGSSGPQTFTSSEYKFSVTYDSGRFVESTKYNSDTTAGASSVFRVGFYDKHGTTVGDKAVDGFAVTIYKLTRKVAPSEVPQLQSTFESLMPQLKAGLTNGKLSALKTVEVNGVPGFSVDYTYDDGDTAMMGRTYFLIKGDIEYMITLQAATAKWDKLQPDFQKMLDSFAVTK
jgi:hypothetical protein